MSELSLGAALYFDHELAADPTPLANLWRRLAKQPGLRQWWATAKVSKKPVPLELDTLIGQVASGRTIHAAVESVERGFLVLAQTTPAALLDEGEPRRRWKYDTVIALGPQELAAIGRQEVLDAFCSFASAVVAKAGVVLWSRSLPYASALAMLSSSGDLTAVQMNNVADSYYWRSHWGRVIRGPEWGTFLSPEHVVALGDLSHVPAERVTLLGSGGAFLQATAEPYDVDHPPPWLDKLRTALAPVLPTHA